MLPSVQTKSETLYAFKYYDGSIEFSFKKLRNTYNKDILTILVEPMTLERRRAFESCTAETCYDIVELLLSENGLDNSKTYDL